MCSVDLWIYFFKQFIFDCFRCIDGFSESVPCPQESEKGVRSPKTGETGLLATMWVLTIQPRASEKAASVLNH